MKDGTIIINRVEIDNLQKRIAELEKENKSIKKKKLEDIDFIEAVLRLKSLYEETHIRNCFLNRELEDIKKQLKSSIEKFDMQTEIYKKAILKTITHIRKIDKKDYNVKVIKKVCRDTLKAIKESEVQN